jgi:hypothetical protein
LATQSASVTDDVAKTDMKWFSTATSGGQPCFFCGVATFHACLDNSIRSTTPGQLCCSSSRICWSHRSRRTVQNSGYVLLGGDTCRPLGRGAIRRNILSDHTVRVRLQCSVFSGVARRHGGGYSPLTAFKRHGVWSENTRVCSRAFERIRRVHIHSGAAGDEAQIGRSARV